MMGIIDIQKYANVVRAHLETQPQPDVEWISKCQMRGPAYLPYFPTQRLPRENVIQIQITWLIPVGKLNASCMMFAAVLYSQMSVRMRSGTYGLISESALSIIHFLRCTATCITFNFFSCNEMFIHFLFQKLSKRSHSLESTLLLSATNSYSTSLH